MDYSNSYDPTCNPDVPVNEMFECEYSGRFYEWFNMVKVSEPNENERYVYKGNLKEYLGIIKNIAI